MSVESSKQSSVSSSSSSSSSNIPSTGQGTLASTMASQPSNSQAHQFSSPAPQNVISSSLAPAPMTVVSAAQVVVAGNNSHPSTPSPVPTQNIVSSLPTTQTVSQSSVQTLIQAATPQHISVQPGQQIQAPSVSQTLPSQSFSNLQQSRIPTPQPQQIVSQQMAAQNNQNIVATMTAAQPGQQIVSTNAANSQLAGATAVQPMNIQLQHPQQISIAQPQQVSHLSVSTPQNVQMQAPQQTQTASQVHQIQTNQQATQQIVQHPGPFTLAPGQTTLTVSMAPMTQPTSAPATHITQAPQAVAAHPSVAPSPVPQLQAVIQHPVQNSAAYYPIYATGAHQGAPLMLPGNLTIQPANMGTFHSLGVNQAGARSLTLPQSNVDPTKQTATIMPVSVSNKAAAVSAASASVVQAATHVQIASGGKTAGSQIINATAIPQGTKSVYASQPGQCSYTIPCSTVNGQQAFVIGQLGVLPAGTQHASTILPAKPGDPNQKPKSFTMGIASSLRSPLHHNKVMSGAFQSSKSPILPQPVCSTGTVLSGAHFKHLTNNQQVITSQNPNAMIASQPQILGSFQTATANFATPGQIAQSINWASPGCLQSAGMLQPSTQIVIRGPQNAAEMLFQSPTAHPTFQAVAQPQLQAHPAVITTSSSSVTPVASVAPSSTTTVTTSSAPAQKLKQASEQTSNILPKSTSALSAVTTMTTTTRNLSILPASSSISVANLPMAQVRPASAVPSSPNKVTLAQQGKIKVRPRVSPGPSGAVRPTLVGVGQRVERQTQTTTIQPKPRPAAPSKPTTVAQKLAGVSTPQPKAVAKAVVSTSQPKQLANVNVVTPEPLKEVVPKKPDTSTKVDVPLKADKVPSSTASTVPVLPQLSNGNDVGKLANKKDTSTENKENNGELSPVDENIADSNVENKLLEEPPKEKLLQKAIVKPNILSHYIDGYIILEGSDPFPVNRSSPVHTNSNSTNTPCNNEEVNGNDADPSYSRKRKIVSMESDPLPENKENADLKKNESEKLTPEPPLLQDESVPIQAEAGTPESSPLSSLDEMEVEPAFDENSNSPPTLQPAASETYLDCYQKNPVKWSVQEVYEFVRTLCCTGIAEEFLSQEIDGQALMLLKEEHLVTTMNIKLGPALKICSRIRTFRVDDDD